jgi:hypothetical protein
MLKLYEYFGKAVKVKYALVVRGPQRSEENGGDGEEGEVLNARIAENKGIRMRGTAEDRRTEKDGWERLAHLVRR